MTTILITGAGRGIGLALTKRAIARGDTVFATVRKEADKTKFGTHANLHPILMDVSNSASVIDGFAEIDRILAGKPLNVVINSAAIAPPGAIEVAPTEEFEDVVNTNVIGTVRILKGAVPRMRANGGRIVLITSLWGIASSAMLGAYCASKHAIESLADTARRELAGTGVDVVLVEPGVIRTDMYGLQGGQLEEMINNMSPEQTRTHGKLYRNYQKVVGGPKGDGNPNIGITADACAEAIEKAAFTSNPRNRYKIGSDSKAVCFLDWLLPVSWMDFVMNKAVSNK